VFALAFLMPNLFRRLFGEGAFSSGFVPLFSKRLRGENGMEEAKAFAEEILAVFAPVLILITLALMVFMPGFIGLADRCQLEGGRRTDAGCNRTDTHHHALYGDDLPRLAGVGRGQFAQPLCGGSLCACLAQLRAGRRAAAVPRRRHGNRARHGLGVCWRAA
jgi:hypothetical protein